MSASFDVLPLVVGVTGHRDLPADAEAPLRKRFGEVLTRLKQRHPSMELLVLSGLAAGADLIAAEEAIERGHPVLGCLPMPQPEYEKDFTPAELERFRRVLPRCRDIVVVGKSASRAQNYVDVADFIAYYSHVLVAFWDGLPARGPGGTAQVVELRKGGIPSVVGDALVAYMPDVGPVFHIVTPRTGQPQPAQCYSLLDIYPERPSAGAKANPPGRSSGEQDFENALAHLERFNQDLAREPASMATDRLVAFGDRTDAAANEQQWQTLRSLRLLYIATALAGAAQLVLPTDGSFHIPSWAGIVARVGFLAVALVVFAIAKRSDYENRYQDYRAIAEALRVQYTWNCAGLRNRLVEASYLQMQQGELAWIRLALRTAYLITDVGTARADESPAHDECVRWIDNQLQYYEKAGKREEAHLARAHRATVLVVAAGGAISAVAASLIWSISHGWLAALAAHEPQVNHMLTYLATMPFALGGMLALLIRFYEQQRGFTENARRYQHMFTVFDAARRRLRDHTGDPLKVLEQLGHEALSEHADWLILHRDRPLSFVHT
ncbi:MAG TPA: DUF4231 domain-containing protein [Candidatus Eremiobacteraceae bacterium]